MRWLKRLLLAAVASGMLIAAAIGALYVTDLPRFVAMAIEPISLFLMPGLIVAMAIAGQHDIEWPVVVAAAAGFYLVVFWLWLRWRGRRADRGSR